MWDFDMELDYEKEAMEVQLDAIRAICLSYVEAFHPSSPYYQLALRILCTYPIPEGDTDEDTFV